MKSVFGKIRPAFQFHCLKYLAAARFKAKATGWQKKLIEQHDDLSKLSFFPHSWNLDQSETTICIKLEIFAFVSPPPISRVSRTKQFLIDGTFENDHRLK